MHKKSAKCRSCGRKPLSRDEIGLNKKFIHRELREFFCLSCLAEYCEIEEGELKEKVAEFRRQGCVLFG